jgi:hypothetical protein
MTLPGLDPPLASAAGPARTASGRLVCLLGAQAESLEYRIPHNIEVHFAAGWKIHVPLTYLTNEAVRRYTLGTISGASNTEEYRLSKSGIFSATTKILTADGKTDMTVTEWLSSWNRLLQLIEEYVPEEHEMWTMHYSYIIGKDEALDRDWGLYLRYDIAVRERSIKTPFHIGTFQVKIFRDVEVSYNKEMAEAAFNTRFDARVARSGSSSAYHAPNQPLMPKAFPAPAPYTSGHSVARAPPSTNFPSPRMCF